MLWISSSLTTTVYRRVFITRRLVFLQMYCNNNVNVRTKDSRQGKFQ